MPGPPEREDYSWLPGLKLPNVEQAVVSDAKLVDYLLSVRHPHGRTKARFFASLGYWAADPEPLRQTLLALARQADMKVERSAYGVKYVGSGEVIGPNGHRARLTVVWIIELDDPRPRLVTAYPA
jgi:hypothetical protein